jgi:broad specificity phosphatase PhoE
MTDIYLIRHGQASFGEQNYDRLSSLGIRQSETLGRWLADSGIRFDAVYSGERERQRDTATIALASSGQSQLPLLVDAAFNELDADRLLQYAIPRLVLREPSLAVMFMDLKGNRDTFRRVFERVVDEWVEGGWESAGIGRWEDFRRRVFDGIRHLPARHASVERIAVFTSGGPITATMQSLSPGAGRGLDWGIANTSITRLRLDDSGQWQLLGRRETPHLGNADGLLTHL